MAAGEAGEGKTRHKAFAANEWKQNFYRQWATVSHGREPLLHETSISPIKSFVGQRNKGNEREKLYIDMD